jgi:hypothetical protein
MKSLDRFERLYEDIGDCLYYPMTQKASLRDWPEVSTIFFGLREVDDLVTRPVYRRIENQLKYRNRHG